MAHLIIQLHVMTGCDHNCGFYGHCKKGLIKRVMKSSEARVLLYECGDALPIPAHALNNVKTFVIKYVYENKELRCAETRATQWEKVKKKSTQRLMADENTLSHISKRTFTSAVIPLQLEMIGELLMENIAH